MLNDEIEKKIQLNNRHKKWPKSTCQTRDPGNETKITSWKKTEKK